MRSLSRPRDGRVSDDKFPRIVSASREIAAGPQEIFELIADPTQQPRWDGNHNLAEAPAGQRVRRTGDVFLMTTTKGSVPGEPRSRVRRGPTHRLDTG
jgi:uncharacterized protein YndB with AHSA1/START domain